MPIRSVFPKQWSTSWLGCSQ